MITPWKWLGARMQGWKENLEHVPKEKINADRNIPNEEFATGPAIGHASTLKATLASIATNEMPRESLSVGYRRNDATLRASPE